MPDLNKLLKLIGITMEAFTMAGLRWPDLLKIHDDHEKRSADLEIAKDFLLKLLLKASPDVHSNARASKERGRIDRQDHT